MFIIILCLYLQKKIVNEKTAVVIIIKPWLDINI